MNDWTKPLRENVPDTSSGGLYYGVLTKQGKIAGVYETEEERECSPWAGEGSRFVTLQEVEA